MNNMVLACDRCNGRKKAKVEVEMTSRGFFVILERGGDLSWVDEETQRRIREEREIYDTNA